MGQKAEASLCQQEPRGTKAITQHALHLWDITAQAPKALIWTLVPRD